MLKLVYCVFICMYFKVICCFQMPSYISEDEGYLDFQKVPIDSVKRDNDYLSTYAFDISVIGECIFCNTLPFNKHKSQRNKWSAECSYYTPERCVKYFEVYLNEKETENTNKYKRFDEIDKTGPGFRVLNQI